MLDYKFMRALHTIQSHGSFSKPFLNANLSSFAKEERAFIMAVKYEYDSDRKKALNEIKDGLRNCRDKNLRYLLMMKFLELARALGRKKQADTVYQRLRNSLSDISPSVRDSIIDELVGHCVFTEKDTDCIGRFKKENRTMESSAMVFFEVNIGRKFVRSGDMKGLDNFRRAIDIATEVFHPPGMITAMNALSWYGREHDAEEALKAGKNALYSAGLYFEGMSILYVFDTLMNAAKKVGDTSLWEVARDFTALYRRSSEEIKKEYKAEKKFADEILAPSIYPTDGRTRRFLRKLDKIRDLDGILSRKQVYNLLNKKSDGIRGATIKKITESYPEMKKMDPASFPLAFAAELSKMKTALADGMDSVLNETPKSLDPYVEARRDLEREFLGRMPKRARNIFTDTYTKMDNEERSVIDRFARDYIRYDRKWEMRVGLPGEMERYADLFRFKKLPAALAYYTIDTVSGREKLLRVLESFKR